MENLKGNTSISSKKTLCLLMKRKLQCRVYAYRRKKPLNRKKKRLLWQLFGALKNAGERSSVHGFSTFASSTVHWSVKLVLFMCLCSSWSYLIYQICNSFNYYRSYKVVSSTSVVYEAPTDFFGELMNEN